jgi:uncharacterized protein YbgA (DUF1722 family)/uncharacterized protein YbbK (DUF523 family)
VTAAPLAPPAPDDVRVGVSACLLGQEVRYDGGHRRDPFVTDVLGRHVRFVPVCPEVEVGMGVPRPTVRLQGDPDAPRMVDPKSGADHTDAMLRYARRRVRELRECGLHGYIVKAKSPSCGMERVPVHAADGHTPHRRAGLFATELMAHLSLLPIEDEGRLCDPLLRENFIERLFACHRLTRFLASHPEPKDLVAFHTREKMQLLAHGQAAHRALGRLVAQAGTRPMSELLPIYAGAFMNALRTRASPKRNANVLQHLQGFLGDALDPGDKTELVDLIARHRQGLVPLVVPLTLLQHHFRRHPVPGVLEQTWLDPYPAELMLRNHV